MKNLFFLLFFLGIGIKAQEISFKKDSEIVLDVTIKFDEIVYYKTNKSFNAYKLKYKKNHSTKKKLIYDIVKGSTPKSISDNLFVKDLEKLNFHKEKLEAAQYQKIVDIYTRGSAHYDTSCVKTFRDILVFKNKNKIVGISKICFDCGWETTFFNEHHYYNLIDITYFEELENLLNSKPNSN
ncbi:MAG: hypothetical protein KA232_03235 [Chryseobacterium sp.]|nr:hypothetical protein [Chryseobacterium sp.]